MAPPVEVKYTVPVRPNESPCSVMSVLLPEVGPFDGLILVRDGGL